MGAEGQECPAWSWSWQAPQGPGAPGLSGSVAHWQGRLSLGHDVCFSGSLPARAWLPREPLPCQGGHVRVARSGHSAVLAVALGSPSRGHQSGGEPRSDTGLDGRQCRRGLLTRTYADLSVGTIWVLGRHMGPWASGVGSSLGHAQAGAHFTDRVMVRTAAAVRGWSTGWWGAGCCLARGSRDSVPATCMDPQHSQG